MGGSFSDVGGYEPFSMQLKYVITAKLERGKIYRLQYRVRNAIGWSDFSPILYALAAGVPSRPAAPTIVAATGSSITLKLYESANDGGSKVQLYELWRDEGLQGSAFRKVITYVTGTWVHTLSITDDAIVSGKTYSF